MSRETSGLVSRRLFLGGVISTGILSHSIGCESKKPMRMPLAFVSHSAPTLAADAVKGEPFRKWGLNLPKPKAILVISAHWEKSPPALGTLNQSPLVYDFYGFPEPLYRIEYPAPGAPWLGERIQSLMNGQMGHVPDRGLDHGVWVPLLHLFPGADVPVIQMSMPSSEGAKALFELGKRLAVLRDEGVLILGSGGWVHNLRRLDFQDRGNPPPEWAIQFDAWAADAVMRRDFDALLDYRIKAPGFSLAHPSEDHWLPLMVIAGAASESSDLARSVIEGFEFGSLGKRSVQFG